MTPDPFHLIITTFSLTSFLVSMLFLTYVIPKTQKLNPYTIFAMGTAKVFVSRKFRSIILLTLMSTLILLTAHLMEFFFENDIFYRIFEISALSLFLLSSGLLLTSYLQQEKEKAESSSQMNFDFENK